MLQLSFSYIMTENKMYTDNIVPKKMQKIIKYCLNLIKYVLQ